MNTRFCICTKAWLVRAGRVGRKFLHFLFFLRFFLSRSAYFHQSERWKLDCTDDCVPLSLLPYQVWYASVGHRLKLFPSLLCGRHLLHPNYLSVWYLVGSSIPLSFAGPLVSFRVAERTKKKHDGSRQRCTVGVRPCFSACFTRFVLFQLRGGGVPGRGGREKVEAVQARVEGRHQGAQGSNQAPVAARRDAGPWIRCEKG